MTMTEKEIAQLREWCEQQVVDLLEGTITLEHLNKLEEMGFPFADYIKGYEQRTGDKVFKNAKKAVKISIQRIKQQAVKGQ